MYTLYINFNSLFGFNNLCLVTKITSDTQFVSSKKGESPV